MAATLSMTALRPLRETSPSMSACCAATVVKRSSQGTTGMCTPALSVSTKVRTFCACAPAEPSSPRGSPTTISATGSDAAQRVETGGDRGRLVGKGHAHDFVSHVQAEKAHTPGSIAPFPGGESRDAAIGCIILSVERSELSANPKAPPKACVLVVDDSRFVRGYVVELLTAAGYEVDQAEDGNSALKRLETRRYDVVVTDLNMPALDGFAVLETVKLRNLGAEVVILTGSHARDINAAIRALRLGAHDYLTKPLSAPDQAVLAIERAVEKKRQRDALRASEQRFRSFFDRVPVGLYRSTPEGRLLDVNLTLVRMLGYADRDALLAVRAQDLYADTADRALWQDRLIEEGTLNHFDARLRRQDGTTLRAEEYTRVVDDESTGTRYYEGCLVDVSHRTEG
jgi:PAS domain S-box-containing protein